MLVLTSAAICRKLGNSHALRPHRSASGMAPGLKLSDWAELCIPVHLVPCICIRQGSSLKAFLDGCSHLCCTGHFFCLFGILVRVSAAVFGRSKAKHSSNKAMTAQDE